MSFGNLEYVVYIVLITLMVAGLYSAYVIWKRRAIRALVTNEPLRKSLLRVSPLRAAVKTLLVMISILLFALVMLRPQWGERTREVRNEGTDLLVALDVSRSMTAKDVAPDRLVRARDAVRMIAESLQGDRAGLILFAGDAFLQCPLTPDMGAFMMFLDAAGPGSVRMQGTDVGAALGAARRVYEKKRLTSKVLVLITDGEDHEGSVMSEAEKLKDMGVSIYTVGVGTRSGGEIPAGGEDESDKSFARDSAGRIITTKKNTGLLEKIARASGGEYLDISGSLSDVYKILRVVSKQEKADFGSRIIKEKKEQYQVFTLILILLLALELLITERRGLMDGWLSRLKSSAGGKK